MDLTDFLLNLALTQEDQSTKATETMETAKKPIDPNMAKLNKQLLNEAKNGNLPKIQFLLEAGADVNGTNDDEANLFDEGLTPIMLAVCNGHTDVVAFLIKSGANVNARKKILGEPILEYAAINGDIPTSKILIKAGADTNAIIDDHANESLLMEICSRKCIYPHIVELLINNGAKVNAKSKYGKTALMCAAKRGSKPTVALLIERNAEINEKDEFNYTALSYAVRENHFDIALYLLSKMSSKQIEEEFSYPKLEAWLFSKLPSANEEQATVIIHVLGKRYTYMNCVNNLGFLYAAQAFASNAYTFLSSILNQDNPENDGHLKKRLHTINSEKQDVVPNKYLPSLTKKRKRSRDEMEENTHPVKKTCTENEKQITSTYRDVEMNKSSSDSESDDEISPAVKSCNKF